MAAMMCHSSASVRRCKLSASWMVKAVVQVALQNWVSFLREISSIEGFSFSHVLGPLLAEI